MQRPSARGSLEDAERALAAVADYPLQAEAAALRVLSAGRVDPEAGSVAEHAAGLVARETGRLGAARRRLRRAIALAESGGVAERAVEARLSLALVLLQSGYPEQALAELDRAGEGAPGRLRGQILVQRALVHIRMRRFDEALDDSRRALPLLRRADDRLNEARLYSNRGILHAWRNALGLAEMDLNKALNLYSLLGSKTAAAQVLHNLGYVSALRGDVPTALSRYDQAARAFAEQGLGAAALSVDRAELLLSARLLPEARQHIEIGVAALEAAGNSFDLAEAKLLLSQVALVQGDLLVAGSAARSARRQLIRRAGSVGRLWPDSWRLSPAGPRAWRPPGSRPRPPGSPSRSARRDGRCQVSSAASWGPVPRCRRATPPRRGPLCQPRKAWRIRGRRRSACASGTAKP